MISKPKSEDPLSNNERQKIAVEVWKKVVQTQEHFNEICMKVRTLYATVMAALLSVYGILSKQSPVTTGNSFIIIEPILPISISGALATALFYFADRYWYHSLLLGAVD